MIAGLCLLLQVMGSCARSQAVDTNGAGSIVTLTVNSNQVLREDANRFVGIDVNYIRDMDANREPGARPLTDALNDMGARWLRYPGGEKSDYYQWSQPPFNSPNPISLGDYAHYHGVRMDFDKYIATARAVRAEPFVVVGFGPEQSSGMSEQQWIDSAAAWVKYANITKKNNVRYWEIGNENWNNKGRSAAETAQAVVQFSKAMKAVDPTINIGASGSNDSWWKDFLPIASSSLDFLIESDYPCYNWQGYSSFLRDPDLAGAIETAEHAIDRYAMPADTSRLKVIATEVNSADFANPGWPKTNTLGHALVTFDTLGQAMEQKRAVCAMVWTTRWMDDTEALKSQWYALGPANNLLPTGRAVAMWGQFLQSDLVTTSGATQLVTAYASRSNDGKRTSIWIINRDMTAPAVVNAVVANQPRQYHQATRYEFSGSGVDDPSPAWRLLGRVNTKGDQIAALTIPPLSVTILTLQ